MRTVRLDDVIDFAGWRRAARELYVAGVPPGEVTWCVAGSEPSLLCMLADPEYSKSGPATGFTVPAAFLDLARTVVLHADPGRFALLYRLLWRIAGGESRLLADELDPDLRRARAMAAALGREVHKTKAFVRFRRADDEHGEAYAAWFEPAHYVLERAIPHFVNRFAAMRWTIRTPYRSAIWDGTELVWGPGGDRPDLDEDPVEEEWRTYYRATTIAGKSRPRTMAGKMPRRFWANLPEGACIAGSEDMRAGDDACGGTAGGVHPAEACADLPALRAAAGQCRLCGLHERATRAVLGEGPADAAIMLVGEAPGDAEDQAGRPFIGPAGAVLDEALDMAGLDRDTCYVTGAVKHFGFDMVNGRRQHRSPGPEETAACAGWLRRELELVDPEVVVLMGRTAIRAVLGRALAVGPNRGRIIPLGDRARAVVTVHPAHVLRQRELPREEALAGFAADLRLAVQAVAA